MTNVVQLRRTFSRRPFVRPLPLERPVERTSPSPLANPAMKFEEFVEVNADRIWTVLRAGDIRDRSFNELARQLWTQL